MIYKPEKDVMIAFSRLRGNPNFETFIKFIRECRDRTDREGSKAVEDYSVRWHQGGSQDLTEILDLFNLSRGLK
jgi:hypothetical protein